MASLLSGQRTIPSLSSFFPLPGEGVQSHEKGRPQDENEGNCREETPSELRIRRGPQIHAKSEVLKGHIADVKPSGTAYLIFPVNVMNVPIRVLVNPRPGNLQEILALAKS